MKQWEECAPSMNVLKCTNNVLLCLVLLPKRPILRFFRCKRKPLSCKPMTKQTARKHRGETFLPPLRGGTQEKNKTLTYKNNYKHLLIPPAVARHKTSAEAAISREIEIPLQAKRGGRTHMSETLACASAPHCFASLL